MRFGVLGFGYQHFTPLERQFHDRGYYTVNLGDNAQSIAVRHVYRQLGIPDAQMLTVNRDTLADYDGEPVVLVMNGVFMEFSFPMPERVVPIFVGFHASREVIGGIVPLLKRHEPIGCRDTATTAHVAAHGIQAFTTGCLTMTLPPRDVDPPAPKLLVVSGWQQLFPSRVLKHIPAPLADTAEFIYHRLPVSRYPLSPQQCLEAERYELDLLAQYRDRATLVLTPLHHVCTPCLAMGIPVIVCRNDPDPRFSFLESLLPIYTPERFHAIDWSPRPVPMDGIRRNLVDVLRARLRPYLDGGADAMCAPATQGRHV